MLMCLTESVRSYYNLILKKAGQFLTDLQVNLLKFALALRSYSPAVHASQQVWCDQNTMRLTILKPSQKQLGCITREPLSVYPNLDRGCFAYLTYSFCQVLWHDL